MTSAKQGLPVVGQETYYRTTSKVTLRHARRAVQLVLLGLWLALFLATRDQAAALLPPTLFLQLDPLVALLTMGAARVLVPALLWGALVFMVRIQLRNSRQTVERKLRARCCSSPCATQPSCT